MRWPPPYPRGDQWRTPGLGGCSLTCRRPELESERSSPGGVSIRSLMSFTGGCVEEDDESQADPCRSFITLHVCQVWIIHQKVTSPYWDFDKLCWNYLVCTFQGASALLSLFSFLLSNKMRERNHKIQKNDFFFFCHAMNGFSHFHPRIYSFPINKSHIKFIYINGHVSGRLPFKITGLKLSCIFHESWRIEGKEGAVAHTYSFLMARDGPHSTGTAKLICWTS